ncbi:MAG: TonB-dependent receptor [Daejeonella sp.]|uniref:TonB-dependent receptor n=1 Tax=Daejeonella sp. TaxID=2805397 RepID=UPI003C77AFD0
MKNTYIIFRITIAFLITLGLQSSAASQDQKINFSKENISLENVLQEIKRQTGYKFLYTEEMIKTTKPVNVQFKNASLQEALKQCFADKSLTYTVNMNTVVVRRKPEVQNEVVNPITVGGTVTDDKGEPLIGVIVKVKGTSAGTATDVQGRYTLNVPEAGSILVFSYIGFVTQEVSVNGRTDIDIRLSAESTSLNEVVVVGYGTQKKVNLTGSVSSVSGKEIAERPVSNSALALQGIAPGLSIVNNGGAPGADDLKIRIRGTGTLNNSNPLVLVDGIPQSLSDVAPNEIESISILKDAASASIYGSRAGNGVILVTTKRGVKEGVAVNYDSYVGSQEKVFWPEPASPGDYLRLHNEAYENARLPVPYSEEWIKNAEAGTEPLKYPFTDWRPAVFNDNAFQQNHSLSLSSGGKSGRVSLALNYLDRDGIINKHNFERYSMRLNTDLYLNKKLSVNADVMYRRRNYTGVGRSPQEILQSLLHAKQSVVGTYPNGSHDLVGSLRNTYAVINKSGSDNRNSDDIVGTLGFKFDIIKDLSLKGSLTVNNTVTENRLYQRKLEMTNFFTGAPIPVGSWWSQNFLRESRERNLEPNYKLYADYSKNFSKHGIKAMIGYDEISNQYRVLGSTRDNFYSNDIQELDAGDPKNWTNYGSSSEWRLRSFFSRLNYSFSDKYLLEANIRYDGSSRFSKGKKYGAFPSFSAGWRVSEENFLKNNKVINNLKIRGSWGQLGNQEIPLYRNVPVYALNQGYNFNGNVVVGAAQTTAANPDITWETTTMTDIGVDMEFFGGKFSVTGDYYWRNTSDILFALPIAPSIGIAAPTQNAAKVENKGWELALSYQGNSNSDKFQYNVGFNISDVVNKITDLNGTGPYYQDKFNIWQEGYSINTLYGYKTLGLYRSQADLDKYPKINPQETLGDIIYEDVNKDGVVNSKDRVVIGNSDPRYALGLNLSASFKSFDVSMFMQGVLKAQSNLDGALIEGPDWENYTTDDMVQNRYHATKNPDGTMPRVSYGNGWNIFVSDFWIQNTSYVRLKNFQLGYTLPAGLLQKAKISKLRFYVSGENQLTFTKTKWVDPEFPAGRLQYFPQSKVLTAGMNFSF